MCADMFFFCGRGLHLRSTWCGSPVHCRSPVIVRTLAQTCRNLWWFHRCSPWTSCGYASYCADSGSDVQKTVETFHSCSSWSMLLVSFRAAQWSRLLLPCSKEAFATHSGACRCVFAMSHSCDSHGASRSFVFDIKQPSVSLRTSVGDRGTHTTARLPFTSTRA